MTAQLVPFDPDPDPYIAELERRTGRSMAEARRRAAERPPLTDSQLDAVRRAFRPISTETP